MFFEVNLLEKEDISNRCFSIKMKKNHFVLVESLTADGSCLTRYFDAIIRY